MQSDTKKIKRVGLEILQVTPLQHSIITAKVDAEINAEVNKFLDLSGVSDNSKKSFIRYAIYEYIRDPQNYHRMVDINTNWK